MGENVVKATEDSLDAFLSADQASFNQPWQKLDRGARLDRLRKYVQAYPDLSQAEAASLLAAVLQAYETKQLNTKLAIDYDPVNARVTAIRGLKERVGLSGLRTFRIESTVRATIRKKATQQVATQAVPTQAVATQAVPTQQVASILNPETTVNT
jgi:hypothetical protein